jgi:hypothetical protein
MSDPRDLHRGATRAMSVLMIVIGAAMIASTVARGGGILAIGLILGALFVAAGALRLRLTRKGG